MGVWETKYVLGAKVSIIDYKVGTVSFWNVDGILWIEVMWRNGIWFDSVWLVIVVGFVKDGYCYGVWTCFIEDGRKVD